MGQTAFSYKVGDYRILLEAGMRSEVLTLDTVYPVPYAPDWCAGLANVRGDLCPVIDMHGVLFKQQRPKKQYLLWLQHEAFAPVVVSCDELPKQVNVPETSEQSGRIPGIPGWVQTIWSHDKVLLLAADHGRLLRLLSKTKSSGTTATAKENSI